MKSSFIVSEAVARRCSEKVFGQILQNSQKKSCHGVRLKLQDYACNSKKKGPIAGVLLLVLQTFKNRFCIKHLRASAFFILQDKSLRKFKFNKKNTLHWHLSGVSCSIWAHWAYQSGAFVVNLKHATANSRKPSKSQESVLSLKCTTQFKRKHPNGQKTPVQKKLTQNDRGTRRRTFTILWITLSNCTRFLDTLWNKPKLNFYLAGLTGCKIYWYMEIWKY